jgi:hypothetical protein
MLNTDERPKLAVPTETSFGIAALTLDAIRGALARVAAERGCTLMPLVEGLPLNRCGLDRGELATVVAMLEDALGVNPFTSSEAPGYITLAEFVGAYDRELAKQMFIDLEY